MMKKRKGKLLIPGDIIGFVTSKLVRWNYGNNFFIYPVSRVVRLDCREDGNKDGIFFFFFFFRPLF